MLKIQSCKQIVVGFCSHLLYVAANEKRKGKKMRASKEIKLEIS